MLLVIVGRTASRFSYSNYLGTGSRSHDLGIFFWRISKTYCSVNGVNICSSLPEQAVLSVVTVGLVGRKLFLIVMILVGKYSEKACGMSPDSKEDGRGVEIVCLEGY